MGTGGLNSYLPAGSGAASTGESARGTPAPYRAVHWAARSRVLGWLDGSWNQFIRNAVGAEQIRITLR